MSFIDDILNDAVSAAQIATNTQAGAYDAGGFSLSSGLQSLLTVGTGYAKGLADIDLARKAVRVQQQAQQPTIATTQSPIYFGNAATGGIRLGNMLPLLLLGVGAYVLLKKA